MLLELLAGFCPDMLLGLELLLKEGRKSFRWRSCSFDQIHDAPPRF